MDKYNFPWYILLRMIHLTQIITTYILNVFEKISFATVGTRINVAYPELNVYTCIKTGHIPN
jgi:hypothetical protein